MKSNLKDIIESIPDFEDFILLTGEISSLSLEKMTLDSDIKAAEAAIMRNSMSNSVHFVGGKAPSVAYIESAYLHTGFDGELLEIRKALAEVTARLEGKKLILSVYRDMLEIFRTVSANERLVAS